MKNIIPIYDEVLLAVNQDQQELITAFNKKIKIIDTISATPHLMVRLNATHSGFVNRNKFFYTPSKMRKSVDKWTHPYQKPVLKHHEDRKDAIGTVIQATYFDQEPDPSHKNYPKGYIQLLANITDEESIIKISDQRLNTVSVAGGSSECACSICNQDIASDGICVHTRGKWYSKDDENEDDQQECYWIVGAVDYQEVSFVNKPADPFGSVVNMELSTQSDGNTTALDFIVNSGNKQIMLQDFVEESIEVNLGDSKETNMPKSKKDTEKTTNIKEPAAVKDDDKKIEDAKKKQPDTQFTKEDVNTDPKEDTKNDTLGPVFTDEEIEEIKELDSQLDDIIDELAKSLPEFEDAKLSAAKRKSFPSSTFCGPGRSFPVPDCAHVKAARQLIGRAKVSSSTKSKILACVSRKAKSMNCGSASKKTQDGVDLQIAIEVLTEKLSAVQEELEFANHLVHAKDSQISDLEATQERLLTENTELRAGSHEDKAKEVLRLKEALNKPDVRNITEEDNEEKRKEIRAETLTKFSKRSTQSLEDSLVDLRLEYKEFKAKQDKKVLPVVTNPGVVKESEDTGDHTQKSNIPDFSRMSHADKRDWFMHMDKKR